MTEEDFETATVELVPKNQLAVMVSDLPEEKSAVLMSQFSNFFVDVQTWEKKAKAIVVTNENQKAQMDQARQGRLYIRKIRINIENIRKTLKEESIKEGRAIDKVANFLKDALEPIETYLDKQEHFVEHREAEKEAKIQAEIEARMEAERIAEELRKAEELEVTNREVERLRKEVVEKDRIANQEKMKAEAEKEKIQLKAKAEIEKANEATKKAEAIILANQQAEAKAEADRLKKAQALKTASDVVKLEKFLDDLKDVPIPLDLTSLSAKKTLGDVQGHLNMIYVGLRGYIKSQEMEEEI